MAQGVAKFFGVVPLSTQRFDLNGGAVAKETIPIVFPCELVYFAVTLDSTDAGGATLVLKKVAAGGSTATTVATLTVPAANRQGYTLYERPTTHVSLVPGDRLSVEVTAEGVSAGAYAYGTAVVEHKAESAGNLSYFVAA